MLMKKFLIASFLVTALFFTQSFAETFTKYTGDSPQDKAFAKNVYNLLHEHGVKAVEVSSSIMIVHINESLYRGLRVDTIKGKQTCRNLARKLQRHANQKPVNVYIYFDNTKVIETGYDSWEDRITIEYLD